MEKMIVWLIPIAAKGNKGNNFSQFHTEATTLRKAIENCLKNADFELKVLGVGGYKKAGVTNEHFINNKFY